MNQLDMVEFAENPDPRCACILLLDVSISMSGDPINALNEGLKVFQEDVVKDPLASRRVEVAIVTFGGTVDVVQDFVTVDQFTPPVLEATGGNTPMGTGVQKALDLVRDRKAVYKQNGIQYYRPWVFMITDGEPTGEDSSVWQTAAQRLQQEENHKGVAFFAVGVQNANMEILGKISVRQPLSLRGLQFSELFVWLSRSTQSVAQSKPDEQVPLLPPSGWAAV